MHPDFDECVVCQTHDLMSQDGVTWTEPGQCCFRTTWSEGGFPGYLGALTKHHGHVEPFLNIGHLLIMHLKNLSEGKLAELRSNKHAGCASCIAKPAISLNAS